MSVEIEKLHPLYAARIHGVDIRKPIADATFRAIMDAMAKYAVCAIGHDAPPGNDAHIAFSRRFGPMERGTTFAPPAPPPFVAFDCSPEI